MPAKQTRHAASLSLLLFLSSCGVTDRSPKDVVITPKSATVSADLKKECSSPSDIPAGELSYDSAILKWSEDRASLEQCKIKHKAVVDSINVLEGKAP